MTRSQRLLALIQLLRRHRHPVPGAALSTTLGISLRTLYRDIATLQAQGARIDGAPGLGYQLREGFVIPPLMFTPDEIDALVLGARWVLSRGDAPLSSAARDALAKIAAVLPAPARHELEHQALLVGPSAAEPVDGATLATLRQAIRAEQKLRIHYRDAGGRTSERVVWPFAMGFFDRVQVLVAHCEWREDLRHFRTDRLSVAEVLPGRYPQRREALMRAWREREGLNDPLATDGR